VDRKQSTRTDGAIHQLQTSLYHDDIRKELKEASSITPKMGFYSIEEDEPFNTRQSKIKTSKSSNRIRPSKSSKQRRKHPMTSQQSKKMLHTDGFGPHSDKRIALVQMSNVYHIVSKDSLETEHDFTNVIATNFSGLEQDMREQPPKVKSYKLNSGFKKKKRKFKNMYKDDSSGEQNTPTERIEKQRKSSKSKTRNKWLRKDLQKSQDTFVKHSNKKAAHQTCSVFHKNESVVQSDWQSKKKTKRIRRNNKGELLVPYPIDISLGSILKKNNHKAQDKNISRNNQFPEYKSLGVEMKTENAIKPVNRNLKKQTPEKSQSCHRAENKPDNCQSINNRVPAESFYKQKNKKFLKQPKSPLKQHFVQEEEKMELRLNTSQSDLADSQFVTSKDSAQDINEVDERDGEMMQHMTEISTYQEDEVYDSQTYPRSPKNLDWNKKSPMSSYISGSRGFRPMKVKNISIKSQILNTEGDQDTVNSSIDESNINQGVQYTTNGRGIPVSYEEEIVQTAELKFKAKKPEMLHQAREYYDKQGNKMIGRKGERTTAATIQSIFPFEGQVTEGFLEMPASLKSNPKHLNRYKEFKNKNMIGGNNFTLGLNDKIPSSQSSNRNNLQGKSILSKFRNREAIKDKSWLRRWWETYVH